MAYHSTATPEAMGIPSVSLSNFINRLVKQGIPMHSLLIARHSHLVMEAYYAPYTADTLHRMFSITKSFTSIAIGLLVEKRLISLDDPVVQHFPEYLPPTVHPYLGAMTIRHMLSMQTCHTSSTYKADPQVHCVESFFNTTPSHRPGTVFNYDTSASHTLCALVEKITGYKLLDFLREAFLSHIGFSEDAYILEDPFGVSMGGNGLMAKPMDLLLFAITIMNKGVMNNQHILPENYINDAIAFHAHTNIHGPIAEEMQGYGYQFWRIQNNGFACYGMGGQLVICLPDQDLIVVTTADTQGIQGGNQLIYNSLYEEILPYLSERSLPGCTEHQNALKTQIQKLTIASLTGQILNDTIPGLEGKPYTLVSNQSGFTALSLMIDPTTKEGILTFYTENAIHTLPFGLGKMITSSFPIYKQTCVSSAVWLTEETLYIKSHVIDTCIGSVHFHLTFRDDLVSVYMKKIEETYFNEFSGYLEGKL